MRILVISPVGEEVHVRKIPAALARHAGVEVTVVAPERSATETAYEASGWRRVAAAESNGFRLHALTLRNPQNSAAGFERPKLLQVMQESKPDLIQIWGGAPDQHVAQVVWLKLRACPRAKVVFYGFDQLPYRFAPMTQLKWKFLWSRMAGGIEANSEGVEALKQAGFRRPLERIFWGIPTDDFRAFNSAQRDAVKRRLGFGQEKLVGYVGRFVEEKGLRVLLDALERMPGAVHAVLIGAGPLREEIEARGETEALRGRVRVIGTMPAERLVEYMNCCDALALPSLTAAHWKEQYGRVIGEAMACGVPVVGSDSGAIPEVIGGAGLVVREGEATELSKALEKVIYNEELRGTLISAGLLRTEEELSIQAMSKKLLGFYEKLIRGAAN